MLLGVRLKDGQANRASIRDAVWSLGGNVFLNALSFPVSYINAWILGPNLLGALKLIQTVTGYASQCDFGLTKAYQRETPILVGNQNPGAVARIRNVVFTMSLLSTSIVAAGLVAAYLAGWRLGGAVEGIATLGVVVALILVDRIGSFCGRYMSAEGHFVRQTQARMVVGILQPVLTVPLVLLYQLEGVLLGGIVSTIVYVGIIVKSTNLRVSFSVDLNETRRLLKAGLSLFWLSFNNKVFWSIEIVMLPILLGMHEVGIFGFALGAIRLARTFPQSLNNILFRNIALDRGVSMGEGGTDYLRRFARDSLPGYSLLTAWSLGCVCFFNMPLLEYYLTDFSTSWELIVIMAAGMMFYPLLIIFSYSLNMLDRFKDLIGINIAITIANVLLDWFLIVHFDVAGAAIGAALSIAATGIAYALLVSRCIYPENSLGAFVAILLKFLTIAVVCVCGIAVLSAPLGNLEKGPMFDLETLSEIGRLILAFAAYTALCICIHAIVFRKERFGSRLKGIATAAGVALKEKYESRRMPNPI